jgi:hypothetical protein
MCRVSLVKNVFTAGLWGTVLFAVFPALQQQRSFRGAAKCGPTRRDWFDPWGLSSGRTHPGNELLNPRTALHMEACMCKRSGRSANDRHWLVHG